MSATFNLKLTPNNLEVMPGQEIQAVIEVENSGHILDVYTISISGTEPSWCDLSRQSITVYPGEVGRSALTFRPPDASETRADRYSFTVEATSRNFPGETDSLSAVLVVQPVYSFFHDLHPTKVVGTEGRFTDTIYNTGNADLTFVLQGDTPDGLCDFDIEPHPAEVPPQERVDVEVRARPTRRPWFGKNKTLNITLTVTPDKAPQVATLAATLEASPRLRLWHLAMIFLALLLALALAYTVYWGVFEREDLTYLRQETWPIGLETFGAAEGVVFPILLQISAKEGVEEVSPLPLHLRASVRWPNTGDAPLSLALVLRDPDGNCWEHRYLTRAAGPVQFPLFSGGTPCSSIAFNRLLLDHSHRPLVASKYAPLDVVSPSALGNHGHVHIEPIDQYCVRADGSVIFDGKDPRMAASHGLSSHEEGDFWTLYVINNNDAQEHEDIPEVSIRLKVSVLDKGRTERDRNYDLEVVAVPSSGTPAVSSDSSTCEIAWDDNAQLGTDRKLIEGVVYVKALEFCERSDPACSPPAEASRYVAEGEIELHVFSGHSDPCLIPSGIEADGADRAIGPGPSMVCGDIIWEKGQDDTGTSAFVILRDPAGNCWTSLESKTVQDEDQPSPFAFEMATTQPCEEILREETLWYLVSWFPTNADFPQPVSYSYPVEPLVRLCGSEEEAGAVSLVFDESTVIPAVYPGSYPTEMAEWHLFVVNGSIYATDVSEAHEYAPRVSLHVKGDSSWKASLKDPSPRDTAHPKPVAQC